MSAVLEWKKIRRSGFLPAFVGGGILAGAFAIVLMTFREEMYVNREGAPVEILLHANWQMMAMLNTLFVMLGACILYHIEYEDHAMIKMRSLPIKSREIYAGKWVLLAISTVMMMGIEMVGLQFCLMRWFGEGFSQALLIHVSFLYGMMLPSISLSLLIASIFTNMWVSLSSGVTGVFLATMLPLDHFVCSLFPYAIPFQTLTGKTVGDVCIYLTIAIAESVLLAAMEMAYLKIRRAME